MNFFRRYRYRVAVRYDLDAIWRPVQEGMSRRILVVAFGAFRWRKALNALAEQGVKPIEAAAATTCCALENLIRNHDEARRADVLDALRSGADRTGNNEADNYLAMLDMLAAFAGPQQQMIAIYTLVGALEGRFGEELIQYRQMRMLERVLTGDSA